MRSRGRPKIYYDGVSTSKQTVEPLDLCLRKNIITPIQHRLALRLRWLYTVNFGLPTVQASNPGKVRGRSVSKYDANTLETLRDNYKAIIEQMYINNRQATKLFLGVILHHQMPDFLCDNIRDIKRMLYGISMMKTAAKCLEKICMPAPLIPRTNQHNENVYRN